MSCTSSIEDNKAKAIVRIREAASRGAQIICLQELYSSLYFCDTENYDNFNIAESIPGETTVELQKLAAELEVVIIASLFEKVDAGIYFNTAAVIDADGSLPGKIQEKPYSR